MAPEIDKISTGVQIWWLSGFGSEVDRISPRNTELMSFLPWFHDFLVLVPEVDKINPRRFDLDIFWLWLQKSTFRFAVTSCHWQPLVLLSQEPHVIDKHFLLLVSDESSHHFSIHIFRFSSIVSPPSPNFNVAWFLDSSGRGHFPDKSSHVRDLWQTRFLCYRFDFPLTVQRKCEHIFASVVAGPLCLDVDVPRRIWVDPHPHRAEPMLCFANKKRVRRGVCPWVRAYPWTYPRANLIWLVFTTHLGLPIASLN